MKNVAKRKEREREREMETKGKKGIKRPTKK
jgi:hypothetical protein